MPTPDQPAIDPPNSETFNPFDVKTFAAYDTAEPAEKPAESKADIVKETSKAAGTTYDHSARTLRLGRDQGLTDAEMKGMTPEDVADEIYFRQQKRVATAEAEAKAARATKPEAEAKKEPKADFGGADLTDVDDQIVAALTHLEARVRAAEAAGNGAAQTIQNRDRMTAQQRIDALFAANPDHFGAGGKLSRKEISRRSAVLGHLKMLQEAGEQTTLEKDFADACESLNFGGAAAKDKDDAEVEKWKAGGLEKPAARPEPEPPKGENRATQAVRQVMERTGMTAVNGRASRDHFPD